MSIIFVHRQTEGGAYLWVGKFFRFLKKIKSPHRYLAQFDEKPCVLDANVVNVSNYIFPAGMLYLFLQKVRVLGITSPDISLTVKINPNPAGIL